MRAMVCEDWGKPDSLTLREMPVPEPGRGEVRVAVRAAGVNFADTLVIAGQYQVRPERPFVPGFELGGVVDACGPGVQGLEPGQRVMGVPQVGAFGEFAVMPADRVYPIPDVMTFAHAAAFPVAYGTSHLALRHRGGLRSGEVLLVHGAAGGVGLTAVEIGAHLGATVIATAGSEEKLAIARRAGAAHGINYRDTDIRDAVRALTEGHGADVIYDPVGGDVFDASLRCINWEGRLLVIGFADGRIPSAPANLLLVKNCAVVGVFWGAYMDKDPATLAHSMRELLDWYVAGALKPHVSETLPLESAAEAMNLILARRSTGKVVLEVSPT